jgi:sugar phosphate isomerase/epimerase
MVGGMIHAGLVSVTFRKLAPAEVIALVRRAGLRGIEWGGDIHAPHGDLVRARETRELTQDAGLRVAAYGSYYKAGLSEDAGLPFGRVLETAVELGAPTIRVWAGTAGSAAVAPEQRAAVTGDLRRIAALAVGAGVRVTLEFHGGTLTDTAESAERLLREAGHANLSTCWQPPVDLDAAGCLAGLRGLLPKLANLHVFQWRQATTERLPLGEGAVAWRSYLATAAEAPGDRYALLEFVERDAPECFLRDAAVLREWLGQQ